MALAPEEGKGEGCFKIPTEKRAYLIVARSLEEANEWMSAIHFAIRRARGLYSDFADRVSGTLTLNLQRIRNVRRGVSRVHCVLLQGQQQFESRVVEVPSSSREASFGESFAFDITRVTSELHLCVMTGKKVMGTAKMRLDDIADQNWHELMIPLRGIRPGEPCPGRLLIDAHMTFVKENSYGSGTLFGCPLELVVRRERQAVPRVVRDCIADLRERGMNEIGIFRHNPPPAEVQQLRGYVENGVAVEMATYDVNVVAQLLRAFLRELPEPILTLQLYEEFVTLGGELDQIEETAAQQHSRQLITQLPSANRALAEAMLMFLHDLGRHDSVTKMTTASLAVMFAPNFLRREDPAADSVDVVELSSAKAILTYLIDHCATVFQQQNRSVVLSTNFDTDWYYVLEEHQAGPVSMTDIARLLEDEVLSRETFVWRPSLNGWLRLGELLDS